MQSKKPTLLMIAGTIGIFVLVFSLLVKTEQKQQKLAGVVDTVAPSDGVLTITESAYDFGTISMQNGKVQNRYEITNNSSEPVVLGEVYTSCMCTTAQAYFFDGSTSKIAGMRGHTSPIYFNRTIQSGETLEIEAVFDPAAHGPTGTGPIHRSIFVETNSTQQPKVELTFDANVTR